MWINLPLLGVIEPPTTVREMKAIIESFRPELTGSGLARQASNLLLVQPLFTGLGRAGHHLLAAGAVSILPAWARACHSCRRRFQSPNM